MAWDLDVLLGLAEARAEQAQWPQALDAMRAVIALAPAHGEALHLYGVLSCEEGALAVAVVAARRAVAVEPANHDWLNILGATLFDAGLPSQAVPLLCKAVAIAPYWESALANLANALTQCQRYNEASRLHERNLTRQMGTRESIDAVVPCNSLRLRHDIEQIDHLISRGIAPANAQEIIDLYRHLLRETEKEGVGHRNFDVIPSRFGPAGAALGRLFHRAPPQRVPGRAVSLAWDRERTTEQFAAPPGICWIDSFLTPEALAALRRFCLESTIWQDISHNLQDQPTPRGYIGSYPSTGFSAPLLYQIADEVSLALPAIFAGHSLRQMWSYKYEANLEGIDLHGDDAAINVNFWITPDDANLDRDGGGLMIYPVAAPDSWRFAEINRDQERIRRFVEGHRSVPVSIPYRQNRAVIFNSDLFHATARTRFKPGYENRRINVTMLFGRRRSSVVSSPAGL